MKLHAKIAYLAYAKAVRLRTRKPTLLRRAVCTLLFYCWYHTHVPPIVKPRSCERCSRSSYFTVCWYCPVDVTELL